jgi:hypothetical protein
VHDAVIGAAGTNTTKWESLDPTTTGISGGSTQGSVILAVQECSIVDEDEEEVEIEFIDVVVEKQDV